MFKRVGILIGLGLIAMLALNHFGITGNKGTYKAKENQTQLEQSVQDKETSKHLDQNRVKREETFNEKATNAIDDYRDRPTSTSSPYYNENGDNPVYDGMLQEGRDSLKTDNPKSAWVTNDGKDVVQEGINSDNNKSQNEKPYLNSDNTVKQNYDRGDK
ncbi:hypothetical protein [Paraclostridium bifermentans]|uniref:hypothetical protein n=1 Tax=Paraclostridium bifermentans TaxID=1490 RepID=UPI00374E41AF